MYMLQQESWAEGKEQQWLSYRLIKNAKENKQNINGII